MAYLYAHREKGTGSIFYIGVSVRDRNFVRAYQSAKWERNQLWHEITSQSEYDVEIWHKDMPYEEICELEMFYIKKYGRIIKNNGSLTNLSAGGKHRSYGAPSKLKGIKRSKEICEKLSKSQKGKKKRPFKHRSWRDEECETLSKVQINKLQTPEQIKKAADARKLVPTRDIRAVRCNETGQEFRSIKKASQIMKLHYRRMMEHLDGKLETVRGFTFTVIDKVIPLSTYKNETPEEVIARKRRIINQRSRLNQQGGKLLGTTIKKGFVLFAYGPYRFEIKMVKDRYDWHWKEIANLIAISGKETSQGACFKAIVAALKELDASTAPIENNC